MARPAAARFSWSPEKVREVIPFTRCADPRPFVTNHVRTTNPDEACGCRLCDGNNCAVSSLATPGAWPCRIAQQNRLKSEVRASTVGLLGIARSLNSWLPLGLCALPQRMDWERSHRQQGAGDVSASLLAAQGHMTAFALLVDGLAAGWRLCSLSPPIPPCVLPSSRYLSCSYAHFGAGCS